MCLYYHNVRPAVIILNSDKYSWNFVRHDSAQSHYKIYRMEALSEEY
jgi:hypothetical protein